MSEIKKIKQLPTANNLDNLNLSQIGDLANRKGQECLDLRVKSAIAGYECGLILIAARERVERELGKMKFSAWLRHNWKHSHRYAYRFIEFAEDKESCEQLFITNPDISFNAANRLMKGLASKEKTQQQIEDETLEQQVKRKDFELQQVKAQKDAEIAKLKAEIEAHEKERQRQERIHRIKERCEKEDKESRIKRRKEIESNIEQYRENFIRHHDEILELTMSDPDLVEEAIKQESENSEFIKLVNEGKCDENVIDYFIWLSHERLRNILKSVGITDMDAYARIADWEIEDEEFELEMKREEELAKREEELMV